MNLDDHYQQQAVNEASTSGRVQVPQGAPGHRVADVASSVATTPSHVLATARYTRT